MREILNTIFDGVVIVGISMVVSLVVYSLIMGGKGKGKKHD
jgi:hypothetical protein